MTGRESPMSALAVTTGVVATICLGVALDEALTLVRDGLAGWAADRCPGGMADTICSARLEATGPLGTRPLPLASGLAFSGLGFAAWWIVSPRRRRVLLAGIGYAVLCVALLSWNEAASNGIEGSPVEIRPTRATAVSGP